MKNLFIFFCLSILMGLCSCSNSITSLNTSTPEEFGHTLLETIKDKDSVAFSQLIANKEDILKYMESSEEYKTAKPEDKALLIALVDVAFEARQKNGDELPRSIYFLHKKAERLKMESFENAKVVEVITKEDKGKNIYWIKTIVDINGKYYSLLCKDAIVIPGKGFRIRSDVPWLNEYKPEMTSKK